MNHQPDISAAWLPNIAGKFKYIYINNRLLYILMTNCKLTALKQ